jgi:hypothetical protein
MRDPSQDTYGSDHDKVTTFEITTVTGLAPTPARLNLTNHTPHVNTPTTIAFYFSLLLLFFDTPGLVTYLSLERIQYQVSYYFYWMLEKQLVIRK